MEKDNLKKLKIASQLIDKHFDAHDTGLSVVDRAVSTDSELREHLIQVMTYLLENNIERLCSAMYRIDVSEADFNYVLTGAYEGDVAAKLADIVIEREMQKVKTRLLYSQNAKEEDIDPYIFI